jgi:hypothetical protein
MRRAAGTALRTADAAVGTESTSISVMTTEEFVCRSRTPSDAVAQHEYDTNPELRELLARAEASPTVRREAGNHRSE